MNRQVDEQVDLWACTPVSEYMDRCSKLGVKKVVT